VGASSRREWHLGKRREPVPHAVMCRVGPIPAIFGPGIPRGIRRLPIVGAGGEEVGPSAHLKEGGGRSGYSVASRWVGGGVVVML